MEKVNITTTNWLTKGISKEQLATERALAIASGYIQMARIEKGMDQKSFAKFMGVSQGLVSKWESGTYNFSISTLISICEKIGLSFDFQMVEKEEKDVAFVNSVNDDTFEAWKDFGEPIRNDLIAKGAA